jgi:hypothetical protein
LGVDKGRGISIADALAFVILIQAWVDLTHITSWDRRKTLSIQILDKDLRPSLILNIDRNEVFESIELVDNEALS